MLPLFTLGLMMMLSQDAAPVVTPRRTIAADPDSVLPKLLAFEEEKTKAAFRELGLEVPLLAVPSDIRLFAENLDEDPEPERVLIVSDGSIRRLG